MRLPDFLIIGAARCGTTSLYEYLRAHPNIYLPKNKRPEPHFFYKEAEYVKGLAYYSDKYFKDVDTHLKAGEASTSNIYKPIAAQRINKHLPQVKLILMLRNPIERAFSSYKFTLKNGIESLSFNQAIRKEQERLNNPESDFHAEIKPFAYIDRGRYCQQIKNLFKFFTRNQVHIILFDNFNRNSQKEVSNVFKFLDIDSSFIPANLKEVYNKSTAPEDVIGDEDREFLFSQLNDDIQELAQLLKYDLSHWK